MDIYSALADPTRRNILELLANNGLLSASDISSNFQMSQPAISQHLKVLRVAKLVDMEKQAQKHLFKINPHKLLEMEGWIHKMTKVWSERFARLDNLLEEDKKERG